MIVAAADNRIIVGVSESCRAADQPAMASSSSLLTFPINYWSEEKQYLTLPLSCII